jgi:hypothetical protein
VLFKALIEEELRESRENLFELFEDVVYLALKIGGSIFSHKNANPNASFRQAVGQPCSSMNIGSRNYTKDDILQA